LNEPEQKERRAHPRVDTTLDLQAVREEGGVVARLVASNLSLGGLYCTSTTDFPEMTRLAVRLLLPTDASAAASAPLDVEAVVVRREALGNGSGDAPRFELGLFFTNLDDGGRRRIARFLEGRSRVGVH